MSRACPFCGEPVEEPFKFCAACGRGITAEDMKRSGLKLSQQSRRVSDVHSALSRKDFSFQRQMHTTLVTTSLLLAIFLGYYMLMKYILHEHMPGNLDTKLEQWVNGQQSDPPADASATQK